jgi:hypothetical protein
LQFLEFGLLQVAAKDGAPVGGELHAHGRWVPG